MKATHPAVAELGLSFYSHLVLNFPLLGKCESNSGLKPLRLIWDFAILQYESQIIQYLERILRSSGQSDYNLKPHHTSLSWEEVRKRPWEWPSLTGSFLFCRTWPSSPIVIRFLFLFLVRCTFSHDSLHPQQDWNLSRCKILYSLWSWFYIAKQTRRKYI